VDFKEAWQLLTSASFYVKIATFLDKKAAPKTGLPTSRQDQNDKIRLRDSSLRSE